MEKIKDWSKMTFAIIGVGILSVVMCLGSIGVGAWVRADWKAEANSWQGGTVYPSFKKVSMYDTWTDGYALDELGQIWGLTGMKKIDHGTHRFVDIERGSGFVLAIDTNGRLFSWGSNGGDGRQGHGDNNPRTTPTQISSVSSVSFKYIYVTDGGAFAVSTGGTLYSWGRNSDTSLLGHGDTGSRNVPTIVSTSAKFKKISRGGGGQVMGLDENGKIWIWGNNSGSAFTGMSGTFTTPTAHTGTGSTIFTDISSGHWFSIALASNGLLWSWGPDEGKGQLGRAGGATGVAPAQSNFSATLFGSNLHVNSLACSSNNGYALNQDNNLYRWGDGVGSTPTLVTAGAALGNGVPGIAKFKAIETAYGSNGSAVYLIDLFGGLWRMGTENLSILNSNNATLSTPTQLTGNNSSLYSDILLNDILILEKQLEDEKGTTSEQAITIAGLNSTISSLRGDITRILTELNLSTTGDDAERLNNIVDEIQRLQTEAGKVVNMQSKIDNLTTTLYGAPDKTQATATQTSVWGELQSANSELATLRTYIAKTPAEYAQDIADARTNAVNEYVTNVLPNIKEEEREDAIKDYIKNTLPAEIEKAVNTALIGMYTEKELNDAIEIEVATALAGMSTPEEVAQAVNNGIANAIADMYTPQQLEDRIALELAVQETAYLKIINGKDGEIADLKEQLENAQANANNELVLELQGQIATLEQKLADAENEAAQAKKAYDNSVETILALSSSISKLQSEKTALETEKTKATSERDSLQAAYDQLLIDEPDSAVLLTLRQQIDNYNNNLIPSLENQISEKEQNLAAREIEKAEAESERDGFMAAWKYNIGLVGGLELQISTLTTEKENLETEMERLLDEIIPSLKATISDLESEIAKLLTAEQSSKGTDPLVIGLIIGLCILGFGFITMWGMYIGASRVKKKIAKR